MNFTQKARLFRLLRGLSQDELASLVGIDPAVVTRQENSAATPRPGTRTKYQAALALNPGDLEEGPLEDFRFIARPYSPWKQVAGGALKRILSDLPPSLLLLIGELRLTRALWLTCPLGAVGMISQDVEDEEKGLQSAFLIVLADVVYEKVRMAIDGAVERVEEGILSEEWFVAALLDPVGALYRVDTPEELRGVWERKCQKLYRPPRYPTARLQVEVQAEPGGLTAEVAESIKAALESAGFRGIKVQAEGERVADPGQTLPDSVMFWLRDHHKKPDQLGQVVDAEVVAQAESGPFLVFIP